MGEGYLAGVGEAGEGGAWGGDTFPGYVFFLSLGLGSRVFVLFVLLDVGLLKFVKEMFLFEFV